MAIPDGIFNAELFPSSDFNKVNLDWILDKLKSEGADIDNIEQEISTINDTLGGIRTELDSDYLYKETPNTYTQVSGDFNELRSCGTYFVNSGITPTNGPFNNTPYNGEVVVLAFKAAGSLWFTQFAIGDTPASVAGRLQFRNIKGDGTDSTPWVEFTAYSFNYDALQNTLKDYTPTYLGSPATKDFNNLTQTGCYYVNGTASSPCANAPLGITVGALVLFNTPMRISGGRSVLQTAVIQSPTNHQHEIWYRFMNDTASTIYLDWFTDNRAHWMKNVVIFGDSISAGYPNTTNANYWWWEYLKADYNITNYANTGSGVVYKSANVSGCTMADSFSDTTCNYAVIFMGTNDWGNDITLGDVTDAKSANGSFCAGLKYMIEEIITNTPEVSIIGVLPINRTKYNNTTLNIANSYAYGSNNGVGYTLGQLCEKANDIYKSYGIPVIDSRYSNLQLLNLNSFLSDGLHPNLKGYRKLAGFLGGQIRSIIGNV